MTGPNGTTPTHKPLPCFCAEGLPPSPVGAHDCAYVKQRGALLSEAERTLAKNGVTHRTPFYERTLLATVDALALERGLVSSTQSVLAEAKEIADRDIPRPDTTAMNDAEKNNVMTRYRHKWCAAVKEHALYMLKVRSQQ